MKPIECKASHLLEHDIADCKRAKAKQKLVHNPQQKQDKVTNVVTDLSVLRTREHNTQRNNKILKWIRRAFKELLIEK